MENRIEDGFSIQEEALQRKPNLNQIFILYSIAVILQLFIGYRAQRADSTVGLIITEYFIILAPTIIFLKYYGFDIKRTLRLNKLGFVNIILTIAITIVAIFINFLLNVLNLLVLKKIFGRVFVDNASIFDNMNIILALLLIAVTPAICEEIMFRGTIQRGFERIGAYWSIFLTAFLFGLLHLDFQKLLGTFLLGAVMGFLVYRSNSIYSSMIVHFINNGVSVVIAYLTRNRKAEDINTTLDKFNLQYVSSFIFLLMLAGGMLVGFIAIYLQTTKKTAEKIKPARGGRKTKSIVFILPGLILIALWYFAEALRLKGIWNNVSDVILKFFGI